MTEQKKCGQSCSSCAKDSGMEDIAEQLALRLNDISEFVLNNNILFESLFMGQSIWALSPITQSTEAISLEIKMVPNPGLKDN